MLPALLSTPPLDIQYVIEKQVISRSVWLFYRVSEFLMHVLQIKDDGSVKNML